MASNNKKLFGVALSKREKGVSFIDLGYKSVWIGCEWQPLVASCQNLRKALASGPSLSIAEDLAPSPALFELAIAPKDAASHRVEVYIEGTDSLRDSVKDLLNMNGKYRGFFDDCLPKHCVWIRFKTMSSEDNAKREVDRILSKYDYAWNSQSHGSPRALMLKESLFCGCCCRTGWAIVEGPAKFTRNESSFKKLMSRN
jgi:hypothetical protein